ncbi:MAG: hypothetical protein LBB72_07830 [Spirochaetaceae bacterium]|jgi:hypothetical protein|nr:hypothetical protein [Spirochaetaceae bacterium]
MKKKWNEELEMRSKRTVIALFVIVLSAALSVGAFAQELKISGEAKSGILWQQTQKEATDPEANVTLGNKDDAGGGRGRVRINLDYDNGNNFGMRARINWENWSDTQPQWSYAFGYGDFFDNQMTVSVGKLGASPWGTGGPEMWKELEAASGGGMRTEWKPAFIPGLNAGFVLSYFNQDRDQGWDANKPLSLLNILRESVVGISYAHDLFLVRFAYRFDDAFDATQENKNRGGLGEDELIYRVEERVLKNYLPGFQIWALGYWFGVTSEYPEMKLFQNWLFVQYAPEQFTAQVRFGYDYIESRSDFYVKPSFYWNLFEKLLSIGTSFTYCQDFGIGKVYEGSPYRYLEVEPKIQLNFTSSYIAFVYYFKQEYVGRWTGLPDSSLPLQQTQWMNLRFCIYF